jgi:hypothetical protein
MENNRKRGQGSYGRRIRRPRRSKGGLWDYLTICLCIRLSIHLSTFPLSFLGLWDRLAVCVSVSPSPHLFVFYAAGVVSMESWRLVLPKNSYLSRRERYDIVTHFCAFFKLVLIPNTLKYKPKISHRRCVCNFYRINKGGNKISDCVSSSFLAEV